ncbi:MAG: MFS transporter [Dehalococcoidia bacterium]|nr:MFS transporter [Dehalococcoidia bacterium]
MIEEKKPKVFYGYIIVALAFFIQIATWGTNYTFGIFFEPVLAEFGWTRAATSGAFSLCMIMFGVFSIIIGRLNDRFGPRFVVTGCGLSLGLGYLLMSHISAIWELYLFYGVMVGLGLSGASAPLLSTISRWFVRRRGLMTGIVLAGVGTGGFIMPQVARWLISSYGWRSSYTMVGAVALVLIVTAAQFVRQDPARMGLSPYGAKEVDGKKNPDLSQPRALSLKETVQTRQFWTLFTMFFCGLFCLGIMAVHIAIYATGMGISTTSAANILATMVGASAVGRIVLGMAGDRLGNKSALVICFVLMTVATFWLQVAHETWMLYFFVIVFGFSFGGLIALLVPTIAELFGLASLGALFGATICGGQIGEAIGPLLAGMIFDTTGSYRIAFLICAVLSVTGLVLSLLLRRMHGGNPAGSV